ncbi:DUF7344 domain-containing protein [Halorussus halobius]|uniref:DUF7344 domain-containing protein n=1 Tax=Halorussus halobius TaxID=1710537 RepID=UPI001B2FF754|nr:hypothetical protein [Halorussus halobius]
MVNDGGEKSDSVDDDPGDECDGTAPNPGGPGTLSLDETLEILANHERRDVLGWLMDAPDGTATVDELVDHLVARRAERTGERPGRGHVTTTLHHVHLPKLADAGVVAYDARSQEVRYWSDDRLEAWHDRIRAGEE